jgi:uncharacterized phage infection (PIP) family protein YhgE
VDTTREFDSSKGRAKAKADDAKQSLSASAENAKERLSGSAEKMKSNARDAAGQLAEGTRDFANEQMKTGADNVERFGHAVHGAADQLGKEMPQVAGYIHSAADTLEDAASSLRDRSVEDLLGSFRDFARRQPVAALAGSVLAGFAIARFLKSSGRRSRA